MPALEHTLSLAVFLAGISWVGLLLLPWQPWRTRERLEPSPAPADPVLSSVTVLIPARNEALTIAATLRSLAVQGPGLRLILVDDESTDQTAEIARQEAGLTVVAGTPLPEGWTGKLWALEQGRRHVQTEYLLLLDADITLAPGMIDALLRQSRSLGAELVSLMAELRMVSFWEKLLCPAFIYFFKLIYPFGLANQPQSRMAAAAGGCILVRTATLKSMGGFEPIAGALIDDCALAARFKRHGHATWIGLSHSVRSHRAYDQLADFWNMVARTAFTQLRYSITLLLTTTGLMLLVFWGPWLGLCLPGSARWGALVTIGLMGLSYVPTLRYYGRSLAWVLTLPLIATLFLFMTWSSALRYWRGHQSSWKNRTYRRRT